MPLPVRGIFYPSTSPDRGVAWAGLECATCIGGQSLGSVSDLDKNATSAVCGLWLSVEPTVSVVTSKKAVLGCRIFAIPGFGFANVSCGFLQVLQMDFFKFFKGKVIYYY